MVQCAPVCSSYHHLRVVMMKYILAPLALAILISSSVLAQGIVTGTVVDDDGSPLPGAHVILVDTDLGAATDLDGTYIRNNECPFRYV